MWATNFVQLVLRSGCFAELSPTVESGPSWAVTSRSFQTIVEVVSNGPAPFGQVAERSTPQASISRILRRVYTYTIATQMQVASNSFLVAAKGKLLYRLVGVSVELLRQRVAVVVQTQVRTSYARVPGATCWLTAEFRSTWAALSPT